MYVNVEIDEGSFVDALRDLGHEKLLSVILSADLAVCDVAFTEELVKKLVESLKSDKEDVALEFIDWHKV